MLFNLKKVTNVILMFILNLLDELINNKTCGVVSVEWSWEGGGSYYG